jgi:hemerythrin superfamily protein
MPDPIEMLMQDHREVEQLFAQYQQSKDAALVEQICTELTVHAAAEEKVVYPALGADVSGGKGMRQHAEKEHQEVKDAIFEIERLGYGDPGVEALMQTIIEGVTEHVQEEEGEVFPKMREDLTDERITALGEELETTKQALLAEAESGGALIDLTKEKLAELARDKGIEGRSDMTKEELVSALRQS